jgi:predicted DNA-binding transcriptional regulator AlpA
MTDQALDLVSLDDAVVELRVSRPTLFRRIDDNALSRYKKLGDNRIYLLRSDVEMLKQPRVTPVRVTRPNRKAAP